MAAKPEDYRVSELLSRGSKAIDKTRDKKTGSIMVRKMDGKNIPNGISREDAKQFVKFKKEGKSISSIKRGKPFVKYGMKPIRDIKNPNSVKYKSDWIDTDEFDTIQEQQERFSGETSGYIEKPKYNEEELQKALDVKVDELIKKQKPTKGPFILKQKYDKLQARFDGKVGDLNLKVTELNEQIAISEELRSIVAQLEISEDSALLQRAAAEDETEVSNDRFAKLLSDFQQSLIKGTKEGIERVSLTAQVRGLQAQKATLKSLLEAQKDLVITLQQQAVNQAAATAAIAASQEAAASNAEAAEGAQTSGDSGVKVVNRTTDDFDFKFQSLKKSNGWSKNGTNLEIINLDDEKEVSWSISSKAKSGGHGQPWIGFSKSSGTIPKRSGTTAGVAQLTVKKIRNVNSPKGRKKTFTDEITVTVGGKSFKLNAQFYRKRRKGGSGN